MICESRIRRSRGRIAATLLFLAVFALMPGRSASASFISISAPIPILAPGQSETVSVIFNSTYAVQLGGFDLAVSYDNTRFNISNVALGSLVSGSDFSTPTPGPSGYQSGGVVTTSVSATNGVAVGAGQIGALETFTLTALSTAPVGQGNIILLPSFGNTHTDAFDLNTFSNIVLNPAPTTSYNAAIDTFVTIGAGVVPEPSSLILVGLGGLITATTLLRKKAGLARAR